MALAWVVLHPMAGPAMAGMIPAFIQEGDPRPIREQIDERYRHGGGWQPIPDFTLNPETLELQYPGDPALVPLYMTFLRGEQFLIYEHGMCVIRTADRFEVARLD